MDDVALAELGSEPLREWIDFEVLHEDGSTIPIRARGVALDGTDLVFFRGMRDQGGVPVGTRIAQSRVRMIRSAVCPGR